MKATMVTVPLRCESKAEQDAKKLFEKINQKITDSNEMLLEDLSLPQRCFQSAVLRDRQATRCLQHTVIQITAFWPIITYHISDCLVFYGIQSLSESQSEMKNKMSSNLRITCRMLNVLSFYVLSIILTNPPVFSYCKIIVFLMTLAQTATTIKLY